MCTYFLLLACRYGRRLMQNVGFIALFVCNIVIYGQWGAMGAPTASLAGAQVMHQTVHYPDVHAPRSDCMHINLLVSLF